MNRNMRTVSDVVEYQLDKQFFTVNSFFLLDISGQRLVQRDLCRVYFSKYSVQGR